MASTAFTGDDPIDASPIQAERCYLLELPSELRSHITELYLYSVNPAEMVILPQPFAHEVPLNGQSTQPHLASVNRQLRVETLSHFFTMNTFVLASLDLPRLLLSGIRKVVLSLCCVHFVDLNIHAASGKPASCNLKCNKTNYNPEDCPMYASYKQAQPDIEAFCEIISTKGFSAYDHIHIGECYLGSMPRTSCWDSAFYQTESEGTEGIYSDEFDYEGYEGLQFEDVDQEEAEVLTEDGEHGTNEQTSEDETTVESN